MNGSFDATTLVFAILAIFVVWKLRSVLGTRTGNERPPFDPFARRPPADAPPEAERGKVITMPGVRERAAEPVVEAEPWKGFAAPGSPVARGLDAIKAADPSFAPQPFLDGARGAYETIILAFAKGDRQTLTPLLAKDVLDGFTQAIADRESRGETAETTFVSVGKGVIEDAQLRGQIAQIAVRFETQLISVTRAQDGTIIDGAPDRVSDLIDIWTFAREITSPDPNWLLVATESGH